MLKIDRQAFILHQVNLHNQVLSAGLSQELDVSEDTIRRDLQELADNNKLIKVHGGALSLSFNDYHHPSTPIYAHAQKKLIARKAAALIQNDMFVMTTGGTTLIELARHLPPTLKATFISGSLPVALEYTHHPTIDVILIGGRLYKHSIVSVGAAAMESIARIHADLYFMGVTGVHPVAGLSTGDFEEAAIKRALAERARETVVLASQSKLRAASQFVIGELALAQTIVVERETDAALTEPIEAAGVTVVRA